jgi:hypothetical protein
MNKFANFLGAMNTKRTIVITRGALLGTALALTACLTTPLWVASFFFSTGSPNGLLGPLPHRPGPGLIETETADDFAVQETAVVKDATIVGLIQSGTALDNIRDIEVELYHIFPLDSKRFEGRVEHVAASEAMLFHSPDQLFTFKSFLILHHRNITVHLRQVYDFPQLPGLTSFGR